MAEVLGAIASVVGIASAGVALAAKLHEVFDQFGSTFDDIAVIAIDLNGFSIVLDELSKKLNAPDPDCIASNQLICGIEDISTDSSEGSSTKNAMVLLSNAVPRLLLDGPDSESVSEGEPNYPKGKIIGEVMEVPSPTEKKSEVDLLVTKWIRRPSPEAQEFPSAPNKSPPNWKWSNNSSAQQLPTQKSPLDYSQSTAKRTIPVYSPPAQAKGTTPSPLFPSQRQNGQRQMNQDFLPNGVKRTAPVSAPGGRAERRTSNVRESATDRTRTTPVFCDHETRRMPSVGSRERREPVDRKWEESKDEEKEEEEEEGGGERIQCPSQ